MLQLHPALPHTLQFVHLIIINSYDVMVTSSRVQVETPGEYGSLEEYFRHYRSPQQIAVPPRTFSEPGLLGPDDLPNLTVSDTEHREGVGEGEGRGGSVF